MTRRLVLLLLMMAAVEGITADTPPIAATDPVADQELAKIVVAKTSEALGGPTSRGFSLQDQIQGWVDHLEKYVAEFAYHVVNRATTAFPNFPFGYFIDSESEADPPLHESRPPPLLYLVPQSQQYLLQRDAQQGQQAPAVTSPPAHQDVYPQEHKPLVPPHFREQHPPSQDYRLPSQDYPLPSQDYHPPAQGYYPIPQPQHPESAHGPQLPDHVFPLASDHQSSFGSPPPYPPYAVQPEQVDAFGAPLPYDFNNQGPLPLDPAQKRLYDIDGNKDVTEKPISEEDDSLGPYYPDLVEGGFALPPAAPYPPPGAPSLASSKKPVKTKYTVADYASSLSAIIPLPRHSLGNGTASNKSLPLVQGPGANSTKEANSTVAPSRSRRSDWGGFSIWDILAGDDSPTALYCPSEGIRLLFCAGDRLFDELVKAPIESVRDWISSIDVPQSSNKYSARSGLKI